jgi:squalene synthase HpnC
MPDRNTRPVAFPDSVVTLPRQPCQVTRTSLFAFISDLCPNRQVAGGEVGGRAGNRGPQENIAVAAEVSLAVAAKAAAENFPVALRALPSRYRSHLTALYGFARLTDDIGDEPLPGLPADADAETVVATRLRLLDELQADVQRIYEGTGSEGPGNEGPGNEDTAEPRLDAIKALKTTVRECGIPAKPLYDLIEANRQDQLVKRYETYTELEDYCKLSANPVGTVVLYIVNSATADRLAFSDSICTALQVVEHSQDVAEDYAAGRIYLPAEDMRVFGVTEADLARPSAGQAVRELVKFEVDRAAALLDAGSPLIGTLKGAARLAIAGYVAGGRAAVKAIRDSGYDVLRSTPKPGKAATIAMMASCFVKGR